MLRSSPVVATPPGRSLSAHPSLRLRLALAVLVLALAGTAVGAAVVLGTDQEDPIRVDASLTPTGPPLGTTDGVDANPAAAQSPDPGMRVHVLDHDAAIRAMRRAQARARREAEEAARQASILEYVNALAEAQAAAAAAAAVPDPAPAPAPRSEATPDPAAGTDDAGGGGTGGGTMSQRLDAIAECESGGNPRAYNPAGPWYGAWQFRQDTWLRMGGGPGDIRNYTYAQQKVVAQRLAEADGWDAWPSCAQSLGYI